MSELSLSRRVGESVVVAHGGQLMRVEVVKVDRGKVRLSFHAPQDFRIDRQEVHDRRADCKICGEELDVHDRRADCKICGEELDESITHHCPPGFASLNEPAEPGAEMNR